MGNRRVRAASWAFVGVLAAGCGGGGGQRPGDVVVNLSSTPAVDGTVYAVAPPAATGEGLRAGDDAANDSARGLLRFPLGTIPPGATIRMARLRLRRASFAPPESHPEPRR